MSGRNPLRAGPRRTLGHEPKQQRVADECKRCSDEERSSEAPNLGPIPAYHRPNHPAYGQHTLLQSANKASVCQHALLSNCWECLQIWVQIHPPQGESPSLWTAHYPARRELSKVEYGAEQPLSSKQLSKATCNPWMPVFALKATHEACMDTAQTSHAFILRPESHPPADVWSGLLSVCLKYLNAHSGAQKRCASIQGGRESHGCSVHSGTPQPCSWWEVSGSTGLLPPLLGGPLMQWSERMA